ncbi:MAG: hypothetical protein SFY32_12180 [Bacteroidota bacterium]|nr:hypothetical protein [Bacteroidota bacterium]
MESFITIKYERELINEAMKCYGNSNKPIGQIIEEYITKTLDKTNEVVDKSLPKSIRPLNLIDDFISKNK